MITESKENFDNSLKIEELKNLPPVEEFQKLIEANDNSNLLVPKNLPIKWQHAYKHASKENPFEKLVLYNDLSFQIAVSKENLKRAFCIISTVIEALEKLDYSKGTGYNSAGMRKNNQHVELRIFEPRRKIKNISERGGYSRDSYEPLGKLKFQFGPSFNRTEITEGETTKLEDKLSLIIAKIERYIEYWRRNRLINKINEEQRQQEIELKRKEEELKRTEQEKFQNFVDRALRWDRLQILQRYLDAFETRRNLSAAEVEWLIWARQKVEEERTECFNFLGNKNLSK
jgi:hypothetical protein